MNFHISVWNKYRDKAGILGTHIQSYKDALGVIHLDQDTLHGYIAHITCILKECSNYKVVPNYGTNTECSNCHALW